MSERTSSADAAAWTFASRVGVQFAELLVFMVSARFLSPAEFGVFALFSAAYILMGQMVSAGWTEFTTSWQGSKEVDAHAFTLATLSGVAAAALGLLGAATFSYLPSLAPYSGLQLLLSLALTGRGTAAVWEGALLRNQRGRVLAQILIVAHVAGTAASIAGLLAGWSIMALGFGKLVTHGAHLTATLIVLRWTPGWRLCSTGGAVISRYRKNLLVSNLMGYTQGYGATLLLGIFLGPASVGLYRAGARIVASLAEAVKEPARIACWMTLRHAIRQTDATGEPNDAAGARSLGEHGDAVRAALSVGSERFITLTLVLATPLFLGLAATSESVLVVLVGERWRNAAPVLSVLAVARLVMLLPSVLTAPLFSMTKQVERITRLSLLKGALTILALLIFAPFGMVEAAVGQLLAATAGTWITAWAFARYVAVRSARAAILSSPSALASLMMAAALFLYKTSGLPQLEDLHLRFASEVALGMLVFFPLFTLLGGWRQLSRAYLR